MSTLYIDKVKVIKWLMLLKSYSKEELVYVQYLMLNLENR